jgi:AbrB family looped-hinge helix DNA binding protein
VAIARSKVTAQGRVSVPADVRRKLGVGAGSVLDWDEEDGRIVVRRAGSLSSEDIHRRLFGAAPPEARSLDELREGVQRYARWRRARD